jgi:hypothetical protein
VAPPLQGAQCPTKANILLNYPSLKINGTYTNDQLVKESDIEKSEITIYFDAAENGDTNGSANPNPVPYGQSTALTMGTASEIDTSQMGSGNYDHYYYVFDKWEIVSGTATLTGNVLSDCSTDVSVKCYFKLPGPYTITLLPTTHGSIGTVDNSVVPFNGSFKLTPGTPDAGYVWQYFSIENYNIPGAPDFDAYEPDTDEWNRVRSDCYFKAIYDTPYVPPTPPTPPTPGNKTKWCFSVSQLNDGNRKYIYVTSIGGTNSGIVDRNIKAIFTISGSDYTCTILSGFVESNEVTVPSFSWSRLEFDP